MRSLASNTSVSKSSIPGCWTQSYFAKHDRELAAPGSWQSSPRIWTEVRKILCSSCDFKHWSVSCLVDSMKCHLSPEDTLGKKQLVSFFQRFAHDKVSVSFFFFCAYESFWLSSEFSVVFVPGMATLSDQLLTSFYSQAPISKCLAGAQRLASLLHVGPTSQRPCGKAASNSSLPTHFSSTFPCHNRYPFF